MISTHNLSKHTVLRMAQRNLSIRDLDYVLEHGERVYKTGVTIYVLRKRDILTGDRKMSAITRLEGTVVLTGFRRDGTLEIITMYRNKNASRTLRWKKKYDNRSHPRTNRNLPIRG